MKEIIQYLIRPWPDSRIQIKIEYACLYVGDSDSWIAAYNVFYTTVAIIIITWNEQPWT